jgi:hypothetical protein
MRLLPLLRGKRAPIRRRLAVPYNAPQWTAGPGFIPFPGHAMDGNTHNRFMG